MTTGMELVEPLEPIGEESALARARLRRRLTVEETAKRSGLSVEEVRWLEEARVYRFARTDDALAATVLYATAIGIDNREARELAGVPVPPLPVERNPTARLVAIGAVLLALALFATLLVVPRSGGKRATAVNNAILGKVTKGLNVVDKIGRLGNRATERPTRRIVVLHMKLE